MKKTLCLIHLLAGGTSLIAQGTINLDSYVVSSFSTTIYSPNYSNPTAPEISVNGSEDKPQGNTSYSNETPLGGTSSGYGPAQFGEYNGLNYTVGIYLASSITSLNTALGSGLPNYTSFLVTNNGSGNGGYYDLTASNIFYSVPNTVPGSMEYIAMACWYSGSGATTYSNAFLSSSPAGFVVSSYAVALGGTNSTGQVFPVPNFAGSGLTSFDLTVNPSPEPASFALFILGGLFCFHHGKRRFET